MEENSNDKTELFSSLNYWSKEEKYLLFQALQLYSCRNISQISDFIQTKSVKEVECAIAYYKQKILVHSNFRQKVKKVMSRKEGNLKPLAGWAKFLTNSLNNEELRTKTATALRIIADFEDFPAPFCTDNINFKKIYRTLAYALKGKGLRPKDNYTISAIEKCFLETALTSKAFVRRSCYKNIIKSINMSDKTFITFPRPTENEELANIQYIASQRNYNPFNISDEFLKPS